MYEIKVLDNEEFDSLPLDITRGSDISDSLGFADPRTGRAYVRYVNFPDLQKYLISHELEELMLSESSHEDENGIRHKKGPKLFKDILMPVLSIFTNPGKTATSIFDSFTGMNQKSPTPVQQAQQQPSGSISVSPTSPEVAVRSSGPMGFYQNVGGVGSGQSGSVFNSPGIQMGAGGGGVGAGGSPQDIFNRFYQQGAPFGRYAF